MLSDRNAPNPTPRWLHAWAVLTVCATLPLLLLGAEVTTKGYGMADPQGFRTPWHLFVVGPLHQLGIDFKVEHSHRLAGFVVGTCVIVLAVGLWLREPRRWVRWLGVAALAGVSLQGILGGLRVQLHAFLGPNLALVHGCFAQIVFATLVGLALVTSRGWARMTEAPAEETAALRRWALLTAGLIYLQVVFGAVVRHKDHPLGPRAHLLLAFGVVAAVVWLVKLAADSQDRRVGFTARLLGGIVALQLFLGVESWIAKFTSAQWWGLRPLPAHPELARSLHYFVGSLLFATAVAVTLQAYRRTAWAARTASEPAGRLEGAL